MLSKKFRIIYWGLLALSVFFVWVIKFSVWSDKHTSEIDLISWFSYGYELGEILFNLSLAYIASSIFSFVVVYLPDKKKEESAMNIINGRLNRIAELMEITTQYFLYKHGLNKETNEGLIKAELKKIQTLDSENKMSFYYQLPNKSKDGPALCNTGDYNELNYLVDQAIIIQSEIEGMYKVPLINNIEHNLMIVLEEINRCKIFKVSRLLREYQNKNQNMDTPEIGNDIYQFYCLYRNLIKYVSRTNITFNQEKVDCWCDIDIKLNARQFRTLTKS
ncbi:hypothetical protein [Gracilibacillus sp. YIM 98692]|uniref:hypothetical protein n=1 Tax=Gracilibacillus sp. YIM 98692 TaxID=2663532 RepID=UPI0013CF6DB8|nr:hypothetical protein [Gracilibacillus sp. YIM 98692]